MKAACSGFSSSQLTNQLSWILSRELRLSPEEKQQRLPVAGEVQALLQQGADPLVQEKGEILLEHLVEHGAEELVGLLLDHCPSAAPSYLHRLLGKAILSSHPSSMDGQCVALLLKRGAPVSSVAEEMSLLHFAVIVKSAAVPLLLAAGADPNARAKNGATPLHFAADVANPSVVRQLLEAGASPLSVDDTGITPLQMIDPNVRAHADKNCAETEHLLRTALHNARLATQAFAPAVPKARM